MFKRSENVDCKQMKELNIVCEPTEWKQDVYLLSGFKEKKKKLSKEKCSQTLNSNNTRLVYFLPLFIRTQKDFMVHEHRS